MIRFATVMHILLCNFLVTAQSSSDDWDGWDDYLSGEPPKRLMLSEFQYSFDALRYKPGHLQISVRLSGNEEDEFSCTCVDKLDAEVHEAELEQQFQERAREREAQERAQERQAQEGDQEPEAQERDQEREDRQEEKAPEKRPLTARCQYRGPEELRRSLMSARVWHPLPELVDITPSMRWEDVVFSRTRPPPRLKGNFMVELIFTDYE